MATVPVAAGDEARLSFSHSIYGSLVEEHFRVTGEGLQLVRRRYAEHRLVEFYGHETAKREGEWWVVEGDGRALPALTLRVSPESAIEIVAGRERVPLWSRVEQGGSVRVAVTGCRGGDRARGAD
ncbi:MAG: DUF1850 domain-containing protein [candidate division NC10 bacterium]|nr:DUF1850 domain-containing protein [candidate division NC10 bacterium]